MTHLTALAPTLEAPATDFGITPGWVLDADLSDGAIALYTRMARASDRKTRSLFHCHKTLARLAGKSVSSVRRHLRELADIGAVEVSERWDEGQQLSNRYVLPRTPPCSLVNTPVVTDEQRGGSPVDNYPEVFIQNAAAAASSTGEHPPSTDDHPPTVDDSPLPVVEPEPQKLPIDYTSHATPIRDACLTAAISISTQRARSTGKRITNPRAYAAPLARELEDRYGTQMRTEMEGAMLSELVEFIERREADPLYGLGERHIHLATPPRPRLPEFRQAGLDETDEWKRSQPSSLAERRALVAEARAVIATYKSRAAIDAR